MKKPVFLLLICLLPAMAFATHIGKKHNPITDNTAIRKSKKEQARQTKEFYDDKHYSYLVNSHRAKELRRQQAKNGKGGGQ